MGPDSTPHSALVSFYLSVWHTPRYGPGGNGAQRGRAACPHSAWTPAQDSHPRILVGVGQPLLEKRTKERTRRAKIGRTRPCGTWDSLASPSEMLRVEKAPTTHPRVLKQKELIADFTRPGALRTDVAPWETPDRCPEKAPRLPPRAPGPLLHRPREERNNLFCTWSCPSLPSVALHFFPAPEGSSWLLRRLGNWNQTPEELSSFFCVVSYT